MIHEKQIVWKLAATMYWPQWVPSVYLCVPTWSWELHSVTKHSTSMLCCRQNKYCLPTDCFPSPDGWKMFCSGWEVVFVFLSPTFARKLKHTYIQMMQHGPSLEEKKSILPVSINFWVLAALWSELIYTVINISPPKIDTIVHHIISWIANTSKHHPKQTVSSYHLIFSN